MDYVKAKTEAQLQVSMEESAPLEEAEAHFLGLRLRRISLNP